MSQTLAQQLRDDAAAVFLDTEHFAEGVVFHPPGALAAARSLTVIVEDLGQQRDNTGQHLVEGLVIHVHARRDAISGFTVDDLQLGAWLTRDSDADPSARYDFLEIVASRSDAAMLCGRFRRSRMQLRGQRRPANL